jgi:hypothetical protein
MVESSTSEAGAADRPAADTQSPISFAIDFAHQRGWGPFVKVLVLGLFSFLIVPAFMVMGYSYRLARAAALGAEQPDVTDFVGLLVDGVKFFVAILPAALLVGLLMAGASQISNVLAFLVYLVGLVVIPAVLLAYVGTGRIAGAYDPDRIRSIASSERFLKALVVYVVVAVVVSFVAAVSIITIVGPLLVSTFAGLVLAAYWGRVYFDGAQQGEWPVADGEAPPAPDQQPA